MSNEAEKVVVELLAKVDGFDGKVRQSAAAFGGAMKSIDQSGAQAERSIEKASVSAKEFAAALKAAGNDLSKVTPQVAGLNKALDQTAASGKSASTAIATVERSAGAARQSSRNLGYQISDISTQLAGGASPFLILAQQGPQVANALDGAKGKVGQFATFLSGPWGAAILGGVTLLGLFGSKLLKTGESIDDLVDKLKKNADEARRADQAHNAYTHTLEAQIEIQKKLTEELDKQTKSQRQLNTETLRAVINNAGLLRGSIGTEETAVATARQRSADANAQLRNPPIGAEPEVLAEFAKAAARAEADLKTAEDRLKAAKTAYQASLRNIREAQLPILQDEVAASTDVAAGKIKVLEERIDSLNDSYKAGSISAANYRKETGRLQKQIEDLKKTSSSKTDTGDLTNFIAPVTGPIRGQFGEQRPGHKHAGIDIAVPIGTPVKAPAGGVVIESGVVGEYGQVIYIDHGRGTISRLAHLSQRNVTKGQVIQQGDIIGLSGDSGNARGHPHVHQEVRVGGKPVDPRKGAFNTDFGSLADKAAKAVDEELRRRQTFENELANLQGSELDARQALVAAAEEIAKLEIEAIKISRDKYDDNLNSLVEQKKLTAEKADQLRKLNDERAKMRTELVQRREDQRKFRMQEADAQRKLEFQSQGYAIEEELLRSREGIAKTSKDRRELEGKLIDLQFNEERLQNDAIIAKAERLKIELERLQTERDLSDAEKDELARAQDAAKSAEARNGTLGQRRGNAQTGNSRSNAGPIQAWMDSVPQTADEINESLESIAAGGLNDLTDGIADAIVNFKSLGDVARAVVQSMLSDLIKLITKMLILKAIKAIFGLSDGGEVGAHSLGGGLAAGGAVGFPGGGHVMGPGTWTSDSIPARLSNGEYVIKARSAAKLGRAALDRMNLTGEMPAGYAGGGAMQAVQPANGVASAGGTQQGGMDEAMLRRLEAAVERGAAAQAPVNLYPTLSPKRAMEEMLKDPGAQRTLFGFMSDNSGRANAALRR